MLKSANFRGISYRCAMLYYNNGEWPRAIREFEQMVDPSDPQIYELLTKCFLKLGNILKFEEHAKLAIDSYMNTGDSEKAERLRATWPL